MVLVAPAAGGAVSAVFASVATAVVGVDTPAFFSSWGYQYAPHLMQPSSLTAMRLASS
jgi:hypothetical protein